MTSIKVDTSLVVALGLIGVGLYGLGSSRSRRHAQQIKELEEAFNKQAEHTSKMRYSIYTEVGAIKQQLSKTIIELEERLASRVWALEKRAGIAPKDGDSNEES